MKITFDNQTRAEMNHARESYTNFSKTTEVSVAYSGYSITPSQETKTEYETKGNALEGIKETSAALSASNMTDRLVVLAHNMSGEDFSKALSNGDLNDVDPKDAETILDHIKMDLVKGGTVVNGFTDDLPKELKAEVKAATEKASELTEMSEGMKKSLISSGKELTIDNLYLAKYTDGGMNSNRSGNYFAVDKSGYLAEKPVEIDDENLKNQVKDLLSSEGREVSEEDVEAGVWLVKNSLLVTDENIDRYKEVSSLKLPVSIESIEKAINIALTEGKHPEDANLLKTETIYEEAVRLTDDILKLSDSEVHATRVLEEVRLKMTTEANLMLLKSGYSIDTKDLESYVEALKKVEETTEYKESVEITRVENTLEEIKTLPASVIGRMMTVIPNADLLTIRNEGNKLKESYESAMIKYEQVSTEVRKDLGDSIKKAFRNVDDILEDYGFETSEENRRAVRILGYNSMTITKDSIEEVKKLDRSLNHVIEELSPRDTLALIRKGKSPVEMSVKELDDYLNEKESGNEAKMEKYSKFLYKLEKNDAISEEERKQYIEMYRLLYQLENTGYAAVGSLIKTGRELTFGNLKEAIKTTKNIGKDIKIDDSFGFLVNDLEKEMMPERIKAVGITEETTLFAAKDMVKEAPLDQKTEEEFTKEQLKELTKGLKSSEESIVELISNNEPVTVSNLTGMEALLRNRGRAFKKVDEIRGEEFREEIDEFTEEFTDKEEANTNYREMMDNSKAAVFEKAMEAERYIDVKELALTHKQLSIAASLCKEETYNVPMELSGEMTNVVVKLVHNENSEAFVAVSLSSDELGKVAARFTIEEGETRGYIACNFSESVTKLQKTADIMGEKISVIHSKDIDRDMAFSKLPMKDNSEKVSSVDLYKTAKRFLDSIGEMNEN